MAKCKQCGTSTGFGGDDFCSKLCANNYLRDENQRNSNEQIIKISKERSRIEDEDLRIKKRTLDLSLKAENERANRERRTIELLEEMAERDDDNKTAEKLIINRKQLALDSLDALFDISIKINETQEGLPQELIVNAFSTIFREMHKLGGKNIARNFIEIKDKEYAYNLFKTVNDKFRTALLDGNFLQSMTRAEVIACNISVCRQASIKSESLVQQSVALVKEITSTLSDIKKSYRELSITSTAFNIFLQNWKSLTVISAFSYFLYPMSLAIIALTYCVWSYLKNKSTNKSIRFNHNLSINTLEEKLRIAKDKLDEQNELNIKARKKLNDQLCSLDELKNKDPRIFRYEISGVIYSVSDSNAVLIRNSIPDIED